MDPVKCNCLSLSNKKTLIAVVEANEKKKNVTLSSKKKLQIMYWKKVVRTILDYLSDEPLNTTIFAVMEMVHKAWEFFPR